LVSLSDSIAAEALRLRSVGRRSWKMPRRSLNTGGGALFQSLWAGTFCLAFPFNSATSKGEGHEQHRLVGWRRRYRHRCPESGWICLINALSTEAMLSLNIKGAARWSGALLVLNLASAGAQQGERVVRESPVDGQSVLGIESLARADVAEAEM
jgi:hypothetical protein